MLLHERSAGNAVRVLCLCVQQRPFRNGDRVLISDNLVQVMSLQEGHGGWIPDMQSVRTVVSSCLIGQLFLSSQKISYVFGLVQIHSRGL